MTKDLQLAALALPMGSLDAYIQYVNQIPLLSAEEEYNFAERFQTEGHLESASQLVLAHLRYVVRVARSYLGYGLPLGDLIQEGNIGLMKAVKRFDHKIGVRLVSFAVHWIKAEIHEFVLRNWRIVKLTTTKARRKLFFKMRNMKSHLSWFSKDEVNDVATKLGVSQKDVLLMEQHINSPDTSFDSFLTDDDDDSFKAPANYLHDSANDPAKLIEKERGGEQGREALHLALEQLDERSQDILNQRWLKDDKATLHELADKYGVSAERVRQLEKAAMKKLKFCMVGAV